MNLQNNPRKEKKVKAISCVLMVLIIVCVVSGCAKDNNTDNVTTSIASTIKPVEKPDLLPTLQEDEKSSTHLAPQATEESTTRPINQTPTQSEYEEYMAKSINMKDKVVSSNNIDFDKDGKSEEVQIVLDKGYFNEDDEMWSEMGWVFFVYRL